MLLTRHSEHRVVPLVKSYRSVRLEFELSNNVLTHSQDMSNYCRWIVSPLTAPQHSLTGVPTLYFHDKTKNTYEVVPNGGMYTTVHIQLIVISVVQDC